MPSSLLKLLAMTAATVTAQSPPVVRVPDAVSCTTCTIEISRQVTLGDEEGGGAFSGAPRLIRADARGHFWVLERDEPPRLFDEQGRFVRPAGRKGSGPGEFANVREMLALPGDSMLVLDYGYASVVSLDLGMFGIRRVVSRHPTQPAVVLRWPDEVVAIADSRDALSGWIRLQRVSFAGREVRVTDSSAVLPPFDGTPPRTSAPYPAYLLQLMTGAGAGAVWVADRRRYHIAQWTRERGIVGVIERQPAWFRGWSGIGWGGRSQPPPPQLLAIDQDRAGLLWVFTRIPAPTWREGWARTNPAMMEVPTKDVDPEKFFHVVVEVIDPDAGRVLARRTIEDYVIQTLRDARVAIYAEDANGIPRVTVAALRLVRR